MEQIDEEKVFENIKEIMKKGKYKEAEVLGKNFTNNVKIQSQMVKIYILKNRYEEAIEISEKFPEDRVIQSQLITIYINREQYDEAIKIVNRFPDYDVIQSQMITILKKRAEYGKVIEIVKKFPNSPVIQEQMANIIIGKINNNPKDNTIKEDMEMIEDKWVKVILNSALADKSNYRAPAQQFIKNMRKQGHIDEEHKIVITAIERRLQQNMKFFDVGFYVRLVDGLLRTKENDELQTESYSGKEERV